MRDLLNQSRALSPGTIRLGMSVLTGLFSISAVIICIYGIGNLLSTKTFLVGLLQISAGLGTLLALYLCVRLLGEAVQALHRGNDRLTILNDTLSQRVLAAPTPKPPAKAAAAKPKPAKKPTKEEA